MPGLWVAWQQTPNQGRELEASLVRSHPEPEDNSLVLPTGSDKQGPPPPPSFRPRPHGGVVRRRVPAGCHAAPGRQGPLWCEREPPGERRAAPNLLDYGLAGLAGVKGCEDGDGLERGGAGQ